MKKIICKIFGHKFRYSLGTDSRIYLGCNRCDSIVGTYIDHEENWEWKVNP